MKRSTFLQQATTLGMSTLLINKLWARNNNPPLVNDEKLDVALVKEFVGAGHRDLDKVTSMLTEHPTLLNAAHDWKSGDFETCLGAASHVGHIKLAQYLIDNGAQTNIFTAALFGHLDIIKATITHFPTSLHAKGPHGFTLLHHANQGGEAALPVKDYLISVGAKEIKIPLY